MGDYQHGALVRAEDTDVLTYEDVKPGVHQLAIGSYDYTLNVRGTHAELQALAIEILVATTRIRKES